MILVDDGSSDGSGGICDRYAAENPGIRVIHQTNGGLASARNVGLAQAEGRYLSFVDSDDYLAPEAVPALLDWSSCHNDDLCFLQAEKVFPDGSLQSMGDGIRRENIHGKSREEVLEFLSTCPKYPGSACTKLYRRDFLRQNGLEFPHDRRFAEDLMFVLKAILAAERFDCLDMPFYRYRQARAGSITNTMTWNRYRDAGRFVEEAEQQFFGRQDSGSRFALSAAAYEYGILLWQARKLPREDQPKAWQWLRAHRRVLNCGCSRRARLIAAAGRLAGLKLTSGLLNVYQNHRS